MICTCRSENKADGFYCAYCIARMSAQHTPGPWYVVRYTIDREERETLQNRDEPIKRPSFCFNTEVGLAQAEADTRNAAIAKATGSAA